MSFRPGDPWGQPGRPTGAVATAGDSTTSRYANQTPRLVAPRPPLARQQGRRHAQACSAVKLQRARSAPSYAGRAGIHTRRPRQVRIANDVDTARHLPAPGRTGRIVRTLASEKGDCAAAHYPAG